MPAVVPSDRTILDLLRQHERMTVSELERELGVTATAVRQRLNRLLDKGYLERHKENEAAGRGRPSHWYQLTEEGRRRTGANFADLARVLWEELRAIPDESVRRGLLMRLAERLAAMYRDQIASGSLEGKLRNLVRLFEERQIPFQVSLSGAHTSSSTTNLTSTANLDGSVVQASAATAPAGVTDGQVAGDLPLSSSSVGLPVLTALACPYPDLAEMDRSVCAMERLMFSQLLGQRVSLTDCRLDGGACCTFQVHPLAVSSSAETGATA